MSVSPSPETVRHALSYIPATDRDLWVRLGMAAKSELGDEGFPIWNEWSQSADNYRSKDALAVWKSFKTDGKVTVGTLLYEAKARGFKLDSDRAIDPAEIERHKLERAASIAREAQEHARLQSQAAEQATALYKVCQEVDAHPYLTKKGIRPHGCRVYRGGFAIAGMRCDGALVLPIRNSDGEIRSLQFIAENGDKRYLPNGEKSGAYCSIGKPSGTICIAEGFATAASIHEATGHAVAVAFDAGNLLAVSKTIKEKFPETTVILCADNDQFTESNPGVTKALAAAEAVGGTLAVPDFSNLDNQPKDFNDLLLLDGADAVRRVIVGAGKPSAPPPVGPRVNLISGAAIEPEVIRWLWDGYLAAGKLHILAGVPGTGKTTVALVLASTLSIGGRWPDGTKAPQKNTVIWSGEDDPKDTLVPRLIAMGADMSRIRFVGRVDEQSGIRVFDPAMDIKLLTEALKDLGEVGLLIVDPIVSAVSGDSHQNAETRRSLQPLVDLGVTVDCAVLGISHFTKGSAGKEPLDRVTGSLAFGALPRVVMATAKKTDDDGTSYRVFVRTKSNIGPDGGGFRYDLEQTTLPSHSNITASIAVWGDPIEGTAREILAEAEQEDGQQGGTDEAVELLGHVLEMGKVSSREVKRLADQDGISEKALRRAREKLHIQVERDGFGRDCRTYWSLPVVPQPSSRAQSCPDLNGAQVGTSEGKGMSDGVEIVV